MLKQLINHDQVNKSDYKDLEQKIRSRLLQAQLRVQQAKKPVIIVIAGDDRSGRHEAINRLSKWLDPRFLSVNAYGPSQHEDEAKPFFWRFWRDLPGAGEIAVYLRDWTSVSIVQFLNGEIKKSKLSKRIDYINNFEQSLIDDGALVIKCWLHISKAELTNRLMEIRDTPFFDIKDELALRNYDFAVETISSTLAKTSNPNRAWQIYDGSDAKSRDIAIGNTIADQIETWLDSAPKPTPKLKWSPSNSTHLEFPEKVVSYKEDEYKARLAELQEILRKQMFDVQRLSIPIVVAFEGWDAAGKGGAIRRLVAPLDAGFYRIRPIAKPSEEEYRHHYLWRFWKHVPRNGHLTIFDRSWYGRVLVERIEGFASEFEWKRAYSEIKDFEKQLKSHGVLVLKFWINISKEEQLRRFKEREVTPHKQFKITDEDYRNRSRWDEYVKAVEDMIEYTGTKKNPWHVISSDSKLMSRISVLEITTSSIKKMINRRS